MFLYDRAKTLLYNRAQFAWALLHGYCSQDGQDRWVIEDMFHGMRGGFFVDIGAYDGWRSSNSYVLERRYGWNGICVEANPRLFRRLRKTRHCLCVDTCVADRERDVEFVEDADAWGGMPEYYPEGRAEDIRKYWHPDRMSTAEGVLRTVRKPARPLAAILRDAGAPAVIEYLSIDTEGAEFAILNAFPFAEYTFLTITVEHFAGPEHRQRLRTLLTGNGYILEREGSIDDFFSHPLLHARQEGMIR